jgi:hypothetical protein
MLRHRLQVPLGTTVKLIDQVFAQRPVSNQAVEDAEPGESPDASVSHEHAEHAELFARFREVQKAAGRQPSRVVTPSMLLKLTPDASASESRRCCIPPVAAVHFLIIPQCSLSEPVSCNQVATPSVCRQLAAAACKAALASRLLPFRTTVAHWPHRQLYAVDQRVRCP